MKFTKDNIPENSGLAAWHFAKLVSAMDGEITKEEHLGLVNTMKVTIAAAVGIAANKGEDPKEAEQSFLDNHLDLTKFWLEDLTIDDAFIDHALGLITEPIWANLSMAIAMFASGVDGLDDAESWLLGKAAETWGCEEEVVINNLEILGKAASGEIL